MSRTHRLQIISHASAPKAERIGIEMQFACQAGPTSQDFDPFSWLTWMHFSAHPPSHQIAAIPSRVHATILSDYLGQDFWSSVCRGQCRGLWFVASVLRSRPSAQRLRKAKWMTEHKARRCRQWPNFHQATRTCGWLSKIGSLGSPRAGRVMPWKLEQLGRNSAGAL